MIILSIFFLITSILYSSVGFGGGSTYLALMLIWEIPFYIIPILALCCNIIVVSGNSINYVRSGNLNLNLLVPYLIGSIPFAFFGASISISKELFEIILFIILFIAGILLLIKNKSYSDDQIKINSVPKAVSIFIGSVIGFFSGIVGIGGGIYLVSNLGAGPRDGLMVGLQNKTNLPIALVRAVLEITVVSIGWYLGGTVGIGTLLFAFGIGPCVALGLYLVDKLFD